MDINNISNEQLALIIAGLVATIRKKYDKINGLELVVLTTFIISLLACAVILVNQSNVQFNAVTIVRTIAKSIWITIQSVAGVSIISYFTGKVNLNNGGNNGVSNGSDKTDTSKG